MSAVINTPTPLKIRDIPPTAIRLTPALKEKLAREAAINNRSLHAEMLLGLAAWVDGGKGTRPSVTTRSLHQVNEGGADYPAQTDAVRALISLYNRLSPEKQLALLSLLK